MIIVVEFLYLNSFYIKKKQMERKGRGEGGNQGEKIKL